MKKKIILFIFLIIMLLSSCSSSESVGTHDSDSVTASNNNEAINNNLYETSNFSIDNLQYDYLYRKTATKDGYYWLNTLPDYTHQINYIDFASSTNVVLCSRPECTHDNETCTAWYGDPYNVPTLIITENNVISFFSGNPVLNDGNHNPVFPYVEKADLNGANKEIIHEFSANEMITFFFAHTEHEIIYQVDSYNEESGIKEISYIEMLNLMSKETQIVYEYENENTNKSSFFVGAKDEYVFIKEIAFTQQLEDIEKQPHEIYSLNLNTGERKLISSWIQGEAVELFQEDFLYIFNKKSDDENSYDIFKVDYVTGEKNLVFEGQKIEQYMVENYPNVPEMKLATRFELDGNLVVEVDLSEPPEYYANFKVLTFNLDNEEIKEINLSTDFMDSEIPLRISYVNDELLLVESSYETGMVNYIGPDGVMQGYEEEYPIYSIISTNDYLNSYANYKNIN